MLRRVARVLRVGLVVIGITVLLWLPFSLFFIAGMSWEGSAVASEAGALRIWHIWDMEALEGVLATEFRADVGQRDASLLGDEESLVKDALVPSVSDRLVGFRDTLVTIPLWLLVVICLAWPVTSFIVARRRGKGRGFEVEAKAGDAVSPSDS